jgi:hypothetical protein
LGVDAARRVALESRALGGRRRRAPVAPAIAAAFDAGEIGIDKVVELTRFATPDDEEALLVWADDVASGAIRRRGDELRRRARVETEQIEQDRWLAWRWTDEGKRLLLEAEMPAAQGAVVTEALDRLASEIPVMPGEEHQMLIGRGRVDALAIACGSSGTSDADATVVIHVQGETLADDRANVRTDDDVVLPIDVARRFLCNAKIQTVVEAADGSVVGLGRTKREPSRGCSGSSATTTGRARSRGRLTEGPRLTGWAGLTGPKRARARRQLFLIARSFRISRTAW